MRTIIFIYIMFWVSTNAYSQEEDSVSGIKIQAIVKDFSKNNQCYTSFKRLPKFVRNYIEQKNGTKFKVSKMFFRATDACILCLGKTRKVSFVARLKSDYILSYQHGGSGYHCHSIIFETNGKEVMNVYNIITTDNVKQITELMEIVKRKEYWLRDGHL